jgi:tRNA-specific 2-thiouridylase
MKIKLQNSIPYLNSLGIQISSDDLIHNSSKTVVIGLSGGVDSSVSAALLKMQGYNVIGIYMKNWKTCNPQDFDDVTKVSNILDIPYYSINLSDDYKAMVFDSFINDLNNGLTPNPDVLCNKYIKFNVFFNYAKLLGADYLAMGHYAKIVKNNNIYNLAQPKDKTKDQTYFLSDINPNVLNQVLFPLSDLYKSQVRQIAQDLNLPVAGKKDSMGICFISNDNYRTFISDYISTKRGNFIDIDGNILGQHIGLPFYTIGQKRGLNLDYNIKKLKQYARQSLVVFKKNTKDNSIILVPNFYSILKTKVVFFRDKSSKFNGTCLVRSSNLGNLKIAKIFDNYLIFDQNQQLIAPGQYLVFYDSNGIVVGNSIVIE